MNTLIELAAIVSKQKVKHIEIISESSNTENKMYAFYTALCEKKFNSDEEAMAFLGLSNKSSFRKIKNRLQKRLINTLFFIDVNQPNYREYQKARAEVCKQYAALSILSGKNVGDSLNIIADQIIKRALKYDFTDIVVLCCRILAKRYGYRRPDKKKYIYFKKLMNKNTKILLAELKAEEYYIELAQILSTSKTNLDKDDLLFLKNCCEELEVLSESVSTHQFNFNYYQLLSYYNREIKNFNKSIEVCKKAIAFYKKKPYSNKQVEFSFGNDLFLNYLDLKDYEKANSTLLNNIKIPKSGNRAWFSVMKYSFVIHILKSEYIEACKSLHQVVHHSKLPKYSDLNEIWLIKEAYISFLVQTGFLDENADGFPVLRKFSPGKFMNNVPGYSKDKRGLNVSILIVQMLFFISNKQYYKAISRSDALKQYSYRYLTKDDTFRSNCFIKMLVKVTESDFHPAATRRHTAALHKKLLSRELEATDLINEAEIIPYEQLWEIVLELLDRPE